MGKKNKKIKKNCPHCGERNKFAKNNWLGAEKTKCKYCGKILANIKEHEIPLTNNESSKPNTKESIHPKSNLTPNFYNATRPALNLCEEKMAKGKGWLIGIAIGFFICLGAYIYDERDMNTLEEVNDFLNKTNNTDLVPPITQELCSEIKSVPAWVQDNKIIDYGYKPKWDVTYLEENKIYFLYSSTCSWCHKQIEEFGDEWATHQLSGLTQECW